MNEILIRIRQIFNDSKCSQSEIGRRIKKTPQYIWSILNTNFNPTDSVISDICREFNVNENWIRYGEEPIYLSSESELQNFLVDISLNDDEFIKNFIKTYMKLNPSEKQTIKNFFTNIKK